MRISERPLLDLLAALGADPTTLPSLEGPKRLRVDLEVSGSTLAALDPDLVKWCLDSYYDALSVEFVLGELIELTLNTLADFEVFEEFQQRVDKSQAYAVFLTLDKEVIARTLVDEEGEAQVVLFVFAETVRRLLRQGLAVFEDQVWKNVARPLVLVIVDTEIALTGPYLAVVDGDGIGGIGELCTRFRSDTTLARTMATCRARQISWDTAWTRGLVPEHFATEGSCRDTELKGLLDAQLVKLALLYTCDRARSPEPLQIRAEFRGGEHAATVIIDERAVLSDVDEQSLRAVVTAVDWCYRPLVEMPGRDWIADRLPIMQIKIAQALQGQPHVQRFRSFADQMPELFEGVQWSWKGFLADKLPRHLEEVHRLESSVSDTVAKHAQTAADLVGKLSTTMVGAVATLMGSVAIAAFSQPLDVALLQLGISVYSVYVAVFPGAVGLLSSWRQFALAGREFEVQRDHFRGMLPEDRVDAIVGSRIKKAKVEYWLWFIGVACVYAIVAAAGLMAAQCAPALFAPSGTPDPLTCLHHSRLVGSAF